MEQKRTIEEVEREIEDAKNKLHELYEEKVNFEHEELNLDFEGQYMIKKIIKKYKNYLFFFKKKLYIYI